MRSVTTVAGDAPRRPASHIVRRVAEGAALLLTVALVTFFGERLLQHGPEVRSALQSVSWAWGITLVLGSVAVMILTTANTAAPLPRLGFMPAFIAQHASQAVGNVIPGPSAMAARFATLRSYGVDAEDFGRATVTVSMVTVVATTSMPLVGMALLWLAGSDDPQERTLVPVAIGATILSLTVVAGVTLLLSSRRAAVAGGRAAEAVVGTFRRLLRRPPVPDGDMTAATLRMRTRVLDGLKGSGTRVVVWTLAVYWANGALMVTALWAAGIPFSKLGPLAGLGVYTIGRLSTLVQVTPGGIGVVEVAYTAAYTAFLGPGSQAQVFTGVLLYRLGTYLLPLIVGAACGAFWALTARRHPIPPLRPPTTSEAQ